MLFLNKEQKKRQEQGTQGGRLTFQQMVQNVETTKNEMAQNEMAKKEYDRFPSTEQGISDRLYRPNNIIGTKSATGHKPTVYYQSKRSSSYGHITQEHNLKANVGREEVRREPTHTMSNEDDSGRLVEKSLGW